MRILAVTVFEIYLLAETQTRNPCAKTYLAQKRGRGGYPLFTIGQLPALRGYRLPATSSASIADLLTR